VPTPKRLRILLAAALWLAPAHGAAQTLSPDTTPRTAPGTGPLRLGGTVGAVAEGYGANAGLGRRPGASGHAFADLTFSLFGLSSGLRLLLSTEESGVRQSVNRIGYTGAWRWGEVQAGDVSPTYSPYSLSGTPFRGGALELRPGPFLISVAHGRTRRETPLAGRLLFAEPAYDRTLDAVRIGVGRRHGTHLHLIGVRARERGDEGDTARRVPPKENLTLSPDFGVTLLRGALRLQGTGTVSALTRDTRSSPIPGLEGPAAELIADAFTPRVGTRVDYAVQGTAELRAGPAGLTAAYERVQPGFESLGVGYLRSDREQVRLRPRVHLFGRRLNLDGTLTHTRDNLRDDRLATQRRSEAGLNAQTQLGRLTLAGGYLLFLNRSTPSSDSAAILAPEQRQSMHSITFTPAYTIPGTGATQLLSGNVALQRLDAESEGGSIPIEGFRNASAALNYVLALNSGLSLNAGGTWLRNDAGLALTTVQGVNAGGGYRLGALSLNATLGLSGTRTELEALPRQSSTQLRADLDAGYRLPRAGTVRLGVHGLSSSGGPSTGRSFREIRTELRYERAFGLR
jgi:hypothetical protein